MPDLFKFVIDLKQQLPACVLIQAIYGGDRNLEIMMPGLEWILAPNSDMKMVQGTMEQWRGWAERRRAEVA